MFLINKKDCSVHSLPVISIRCLLAMVLCCLLAACSSGNNTDTGGTGTAGNRVNDIGISVNQASTVVSAEATETSEATATVSEAETIAPAPTDASDITAATAATAAATGVAVPTVSAETAATAVLTETTTTAASAATAGTAEVPVQGTTGNSGSTSSPVNGSEPTDTRPTDSTMAEASAVSTTEAAVKTNDKLICKDSGYSFFFDGNKSVYAVDSAGDRTACTMLSEYSGWASYFEFNSDIYIYGDSGKAQKACSIPSGDMFLGESDFHIYYISADFSKAYSINEDGARHDSAIILYGGNYYFALDSSIYTVMTNGQGLRHLYSEHEIAIGPHYEHILGLVRIEDSIIYFTDETNGDVFNCQYDMSKGKAYYIDPSTGKIDPW